MKYLLSILCLALSVAAFSQGPPINTTKAVVTRQLTLPQDTLTIITADSGSLAFKGDTLYKAKPRVGFTTCRWVAVGYVGVSNKISNITGLISQGANITISGAGTIASPYVISASSAGATYYQTLKTVTVPLTQRASINFSNQFTVTDNSGTNSTDVSIAATSTPNLDQVLASDSISNHGIYLSATNTTSTLNAYFFGDSETAGYGLPNPATQSWPSILSNRLGLTGTNNAVSGWTLQTIGGFGTGSMQANLSIIPTRGVNDKLIFFAFGVNDHRWMNGGFDTASFRSVYNTVISNAISKGWASNQIVLVSPFYVQNKTYYNDSVTYSFVNASSQIRNQQFGSVVQSLSFQRGTKFIDGYNSVFASGADKLIQLDSLHLNSFGDLAVANSAAIVVDTIKRVGNKLAVNGVTQLNKIRYNTPVNSGIYSLGLSLDGYLGIVSELSANNITVTNDVNAEGSYRGGQIFLRGKPISLPGTGNYFTMGYDESGQYAVVGTSPALGTSGALYLQLNGGKTLIGGASNTANGARLQVNGGTYLGPTLFGDIGTLPSGNGFAIVPTPSGAYIYNTDANPLYIGFTNTPNVFNGSTDDMIHKSQFKGTVKLFEPVAVGPSINASSDVLLKIGAGSSIIAPLKFTSGDPVNSPKAGAMYFSNGLWIIDSSDSKRDTIATRDYIRKGSDSVFVPITATYIAYGNSSNQLAGEAAFTYNSTTNVFAADTGSFKRFYNPGEAYTTGGATVIAKNTTTNKYENIPSGVVVFSASSGTILEYGKDFFYTGTTGTCTVPAISSAFVGRLFSITIKNKGSGILTVQTPGSVNTLYNIEATNTYDLAIGSAIVLMPDGTTFSIE